MKLTREDIEAVAARVIADGPVPIFRLSKLVPCSRERRGGATHASTSSLIRWIVHGKKGVRLDGVRLAGKGWCSSAAALARFSAALTALEFGEMPEVTVPAERERRARAAADALERLRGRKVV